MIHYRSGWFVLDVAVMPGRQVMTAKASTKFQRKMRVRSKSPVNHVQNQNSHIHTRNVVPRLQKMAPFYWRGPRLNLIALMSVIPSWNRLDERIQMSVVLKFFTELPWRKNFLMGLFSPTRAFSGGFWQISLKRSLYVKNWKKSYLRP